MVSIGGDVRMQAVQGIKGCGVYWYVAKQVVCHVSCRGGKEDGEQAVRLELSTRASKDVDDLECNWRLSKQKEKCSKCDAMFVCLFVVKNDDVPVPPTVLHP